MKRDGCQMSFVTGDINIDDDQNANSMITKSNNVVYQSKFIKDGNANKPSLVLDEEDFSADL